MNPKTLGTLLGGVGGAGLGSMTAGLTGINPAWGLLGAIPGGIGGSKLGQWYAQNTNAVPISSQELAEMQRVASNLDAQTGNNAFSQALANDPYGFKNNIVSKMRGGY